jgi:hypothetical protein
LRTTSFQIGCALQLQLRQYSEKRFSLMAKNWKAPRIGSAFAACTILAAALFFLTFPHGKNADASSVPELLAALPPGAPSLVYVDLAAVRDSSFYQHRPNKGPLAVPNQEYSEFMRVTGFDFEKDLDRVVIASWPPASVKEKTRTMGIAEGRFDRAKIRSYAMQKAKVEQQQGHEVFLFASGTLSTSSMFFLDDHRIAFVTGPSIAPFFAARTGDSTADPARERAARLDGASAFIISRVPPIPENAAAGSAQGAGTEQLLTLARSIQWITFAARPEGDNLRLSLEGECDNSADAHQLQSMLEVMRMFGRAGLESPKNKQSIDPATIAQLESLLSSAEVKQTDERVRILLELTPDIFKLSGPAKAQEPK